MITEEMQNIIDSAQPVVEQQQLVLDGVGTNYRPIKLTYTANGKKVTETRNYHNPPGSAGWAAHSSNYSIMEVQSGS